MAGLVSSVVIGAGLALAIWIGDGDGDGDRDGGPAARTFHPLTVVQSKVVTPMGPGVAPQLLSGSFDNPNPDPVSVSSVRVEIVDVVEADGVEGACASSNYTLDKRLMKVDARIKPGAARGAWSGATIEFRTTDENQDSCKGATVLLRYEVDTRASE